MSGFRIRNRTMNEFSIQVYKEQLEQYLETNISENEKFQRVVDNNTNQNIKPIPNQSQTTLPTRRSCLTRSLALPSSPSSLLSLHCRRKRTRWSFRSRSTVSGSLRACSLRACIPKPMSVRLFSDFVV